MRHIAFTVQNFCETVECLAGLSGKDMALAWCYNYVFSTLHIDMAVAVPPSKTRLWSVAWLTCAHYERLNQCSAEGPKKKGLTMTGISWHIMASHSMNSASTAMHSFFGVSGCKNDKNGCTVCFFILIANRELRSPALTSATSRMVLRAALSNRQRFCAKGQSPEPSNMQPHKKNFDDLDGFGDL